MKTTLITGVAGTTGSAILDYLVENDEEVKSGKRRILGIDNFFRGTKENISRHLGKNYFSFFEANFQDIMYFISEENEIDEIYHMAAIVPTKYFYESPDLTYQVNCRDTIEFFEVAIKLGVKRFIVGSSSEIYGHINPEHLPISEDESSHFDSVESTTRWSYAEGKLLTEHYMNHFKDKIKVCHLRFANTYGIRDMDNNHVLPYLVNHIVRNEDVEVNRDYGMYCRTFLSNYDSSRACVELMKKGKSGVAYNVGSTEEVSIKYLVKLVTSTYEKISDKKYTGQVHPIIHRDGDPMRRVLSTKRLCETTGFEPQVSLESGIEEMIKFALSQEGK